MDALKKYLHYTKLGLGVHLIYFVLGMIAVFLFGAIGLSAATSAGISAPNPMGLLTIGIFAAAGFILLLLPLQGFAIETALNQGQVKKLLE